MGKVLRRCAERPKGVERMLKNTCRCVACTCVRSTCARSMCVYRRVLRKSAGKGKEKFSYPRGGGYYDGHFSKTIEGGGAIMTVVNK